MNRDRGRQGQTDRQIFLGKAGIMYLPKITETPKKSAPSAKTLERIKEKGEKVKAVEEIRREAVDLALAGAGKLIGQRLDAASDRKLVEQYLNSLGRN